jgi:hypothetical protein
MYIPTAPRSYILQAHVQRLYSPDEALVISTVVFLNLFFKHGIERWLFHWWRLLTPEGQPTRRGHAETIRDIMTAWFRSLFQVLCNSEWVGVLGTVIGTDGAVMINYYEWVFSNYPLLVCAFALQESVTGKQIDCTERQLERFWLPGGGGLSFHLCIKEWVCTHSCSASEREEGCVYSTTVNEILQI